MTYRVYSVPHEVTSPLFAAAFARGMAVCGLPVVVSNHYVVGPWIGFGSPHNWNWLQRSIREGYPWWFGDHAYFIRRRYYKVTCNAYQHTGIGEPNYSRAKQVGITVKPWRKTGSHIIMCPQSTRYHAIRKVSNWQSIVLRELKQHTDRRIIIRTKKDRRPLSADLVNAWCLITFTSNAAVEAVLAGVPVICTAPCAASIMGSSRVSDVENPVIPDLDRWKWAATLAANQWTMNEIRNGQCWRAIGYDYFKNRRNHQDSQGVPDLHPSRPQVSESGANEQV